MRSSTSNEMLTPLPPSCWPVSSTYLFIMVIWFCHGVDMFTSLVLSVSVTVTFVIHFHTCIQLMRWCLGVFMTCLPHPSLFRPPQAGMMKQQEFCGNVENIPHSSVLFCRVFCSSRHTHSFCSSCHSFISYFTSFTKHLMLSEAYKASDVIWGIISHACICEHRSHNIQCHA